MSEFKKIVQSFMDRQCEDCPNYPLAGETFFVDGEFYGGTYWFYECDDFITDVHDFYIKKDYVETTVPHLEKTFFLNSGYIISGSGEWITPYGSIEPSSVMIMDAGNNENRFILHGKSRFYVVGMRFKEKMIEECLIQKRDLRKSEIKKIFFETRSEITGKIAEISADILNCKMTGKNAGLFFEAKAREWLSVTMDAYDKNMREIPISETDKSAIEGAAKYIEDHFAMDISQDFLERIAAMSGTKLKETFRKRYRMSITEFTQRKRMNMAENLLLDTEMEIGNIAETVGYSSPSRFSTLFKRYKGVYPREIRTICEMSHHERCSCRRKE